MNGHYFSQLCTSNSSVFDAMKLWRIDVILGQITLQSDSGILTHSTKNCFMSSDGATIIESPIKHNSYFSIDFLNGFQETLVSLIIALIRGPVMQR